MSIIDGDAQDIVTAMHNTVWGGKWTTLATRNLLITIEILDLMSKVVEEERGIQKF